MAHVATEVRVTVRGDRENVHASEMGQMVLNCIAKHNRYLKEKERRRRKERENA